MAKRLRRSLVALSTAIVATIYAAGYIRTQSADASLAAAERLAIVATSVSPTRQPHAPLAPPVPDERHIRSDDDDDLDERVRATATPTATPSSSSVVYKDGAFTGAARSRLGDVEVTVTIQGGRITRVSLDTVTTQYPIRYIAGLPAQVIARQNADVDLITGATTSVNGFRIAVQQALDQAH